MSPKMSRQCCEVCERPLKTCICSFITKVENDTHVIVLQHPSEVTQSKGTVALLKRSLMKISVFVGEDFTANTAQNSELHNQLSEYGEQAYLLYPSESALNVVDLMTSDLSYKEARQVNKPRCLILLDGTWKKAYRIFMTNPFLHALPHLTLPEGLVGEYSIRKTAKENALSSLEACCYTLQVMEKSETKYQPILNGFKRFNEFQLAFRPVTHLSNSSQN